MFKLVPNPDGSWTHSVLHSFTGGADGANPQAGLIFDQSGNLYGTTAFGGVFNCVDGQGCGTVFKLAPQPDGSWMPSVILVFPGFEGGGEPVSPVILDAAGNLYGTTTRGGSSQNGIVFQLERNLDGSWTENVLHQFSGHKDGGSPEQGLTIDASGNFYGTTSYDRYYGAGTAFRLKKDSSGNWTGHTMYQFGQGNSGGSPFRMILDSAGNLYGTTFFGGSYGYGTVFELMHPPH